jgi:enamine deaminase RidA (YjgF/YER057c/UK114 family)
MKHHFAKPDGHWNWPISLSHQQGVRCGQMIWVSGQMALDSSGLASNAGDLPKQVATCLGNTKRVLARFGCGLEDMVKLLCFYVNDGSVDENNFLSMVGAALPPGASPAITAVPTPYLAYPGIRVVIEAYAMIAEDGDSLPRRHALADGLPPIPPPFSSVVRCGKMIFVSGQSPIDAAGKVLHPGDILAQTKQVMSQIAHALAAVGAGFPDVVKMNRWYVGAGKTEDFEPAALACAENYIEPGPAATGIPIPRHAREGQQVKIEVVAMLGEDGRHLPRRHAWPDSLWDWTISIPYYHGLKCHDMIFLGGQVSLDKEGHAVNPGNMRAQTGQAMVHIGSILGELGADYADICKLTTMYAGSSGAEELHENLRIRSAFFSAPGPATTDISLPVLAYPGMIIEIDAFAMAEPDAG